MSIEDILKELKSNNYTFPEQALTEAIKKEEEITPYLLKILEDVNHQVIDFVDQEEDLSFFYAMFLLAQFREPLACSPIIKLISNSEEIVDGLFGDLLTEDLGKILASVCRGKLVLIKSLIENPNIHEYVRSSSLQALIILVLQGWLSRDEVIDYFQQLFQQKIEPNNSFFWTYLVKESLYLCPQEIAAEIHQLFEQELIDPFMVDAMALESSLKISVHQSLVKLQKNRYYSLVNDTITETKRYPYFEKNQPQISFQTVFFLSYLNILTVICFPKYLLIVFSTDDQFYQYCVITDKGNTLGEKKVFYTEKEAERAARICLLEQSL